MYRREQVVKAIFVLGIIASLAVGFMVRKHARDAAMYNGKDLVKVLQAAGPDAFVDLGGTKVSLEPYLGKSFLLISWASWSPSSGDQLALLSRIATAKNVTVVAINRAETLTLANEYLQFVQSPDHITYMVDTRDVVFRTTGGYAMPEVIYYTKEGMEGFHIRGTFTEEEMYGALAQMNEK